MMKIGITGPNGFIGWHLRCYLHTRTDISEVRTADRETFNSHRSLQEFVTDLDAIVHLAGVNRAEDEVLYQGNITPTNKLVAALEDCNSSATVLFSSSTYAISPENTYGKSKAEAAIKLAEWASTTHGKVINMIIPHVYGEYGRPYYNSAVATFCHQIANNEQPSITKDNQLELIHVQDLVELFIELIGGDTEGDFHVKGMPISVINVAKKLESLNKEYIEQNRLPDLSDPFDRSLFNSLRGAYPETRRVFTPQKHIDERGWLVETIKAGSGGQCFVSTTKPGITRGNHYHRRKVERFFILRGKARIQLRKMYSDETITYEIDGNTPSYIDIPTLHTHNITNIGSDELITLFWADELFDPDNPDTYFEEV